jgi:thiol-disulfide isomerase/thioredoxin
MTAQSTMHVRSAGLAGMLGLLLVLLGPSDAAAFSRAQWEREGWITEFDRGLERARKTGRPAFVYFDAEWCSWCQQYKRDTLDQPAVRSLLARHYVRVAVDSDARPDLMRRYGGKGLPFTVVLAPGGAVLNRFVGVMQPRDLVAVLGERARPAASATDQARAPETAVHRVATTDRRGYEAFRAAYLEHLESLYDPARETLFGQFETGATFRRTPLLVWIDLMDHGLWTDRVQRAARAERARLWDGVDGGFFNFVDPTRDEYLETSKLLEINAWLAAWQAQAGRLDPQARELALQAWRYLRDVLWDAHGGGFFQAQLADNAYYALDPAERARRGAPPVDRAKRADTNAQAAWALLRLGHFSGEREAIDYAERTLDFLLREMWHDGRLYHFWRDGQRSAPDQPHSWFWVLAAGAELERVRPDRARRATLAAIAGMAGRWLEARMRDTSAPRLDNELAGLIARTAGQPQGYPQIPAGARAWALGQLRIEAETPPDEPVIGLWAWEEARRDGGAMRR